MQEGRLVDWASITGLTDRDVPERYNKTMRVHRATVVALLNELVSVLVHMKCVHLIQDQITEDNPKDDGSPDVSVEPVKPADISDPGDATQAVPKKEERIIEAAYLGVADTIAGRRKSRAGVNHIIRICKGFGKIIKEPRRLKWAMLDKKKFQKGLQRLTELTDYLHEMVGADQMQELLQSSHDTCLALLQLSNSVHDMEALLKATTLLPSSPTNNHFDDDTTLVGSSSITIAELAASDSSESEFKNTFEKVVRFSISAIETRDTPSLLQLSEKQVHALEWSEGADYERNFRATGLYQGRAVWIEWKKYRASYDENGPVPDPGTYQHVEWLASLLNIDSRPDEFRVPRCINYFNDQNNERFGFLYEAPSAGSDEKPTSLLSWLQRDGISMNSRMSIAQSVAGSLLYLHAVNWLHKGLRSASITLLTNDDTLSSTHKAYISGFEYSRPSDILQTTTGPPESREWALYSHPDYIGLERRGYRKSYDIYSLGIILLEIAHWAPIDGLLGFADPKSSATKAQVMAGSTRETATSATDGPKKPSKNSLPDLRAARAHILDNQNKILDRVKGTMGERYYEVVRKCLGGLEAFGLPPYADEDHPVIGTLLQQAFIRDVVEPLKSIVV